VNPDIIRYIRENRPIYTREAIRRRLLEAGHSEADIDAAWAAVETDEPAPPVPPAAEPAASYTPEQFRAPAADETGSTAPPPAGAQPQAVVQPPAAGPRRRGFPAASSPAFWLSLIGFVLVMYIVAPLIGAAATGIDDTGVAGGVIWLILWLGGLVAGLVLLRRNEPVALGLLIGFALVVGLPIALGFIAIVIIAGICLVVAVSGG
jgi:hypothetical protein